MTKHDVETGRRLRALAPFAAQFESPDFTFGRWVFPPAAPDGARAFPYFDFSKVASDFIDACYETGWVQPEFGWGRWKGSPEAIRFAECPDAVAEASPDDLGRMLMTLIRQERFVEGSLDSTFRSGLLVRILRRIAHLATGPE